MLYIYVGDIQVEIGAIQLAFVLVEGRACVGQCDALNSWGAISQKSFKGVGKQVIWIRILRYGIDPNVLVLKYLKPTKGNIIHNRNTAENPHPSHLPLLPLPLPSLSSPWEHNVSAIIIVWALWSSKLLITLQLAYRPQLPSSSNAS